MANPNHIKILKQGIEIWNSWRQRFPEIKPDLSQANLTEVNLCPLTICDNFKASYQITADFAEANLCGTILDRSQLAKANFRGADLERASFKHAQLSEASFTEADLSNACFNNASLHESSFRKATLNGACFIESVISSANFSSADLRDAFLVRADLMDADLSRANLRGAVLSGAYLVRTIFKQADLSQALLIKAIATETIFTEARLTGACLEDWNINDKTILDNVDCDFFYRDFDCEHQVYRKRFPSDPNSSLGKGEFTAYFQTISETVDLIFNDGISWRAFYYSFLILKERYGEENLAVQAIEKKSNQALIVRLEVAPELDKATIESQIREIYEIKLQCLEKLHRVELNAKDGEVKSYMRENNRMERILNLFQPKRSLKCLCVQIKLAF
jgi:uncharacterized protein YjbI with pentapeptide repeats